MSRAHPLSIYKVILMYISMYIMDEKASPVGFAYYKTPTLAVGQRIWNLLWDVLQSIQNSNSADIHQIHSFKFDLKRALRSQKYID